MLNVCELRNAIERSLLSCKGVRIDVQDLPSSITASAHPAGADASLLDAAAARGLDPWLEDMERRAIVEALSQSQGDPGASGQAPGHLGAQPVASDQEAQYPHPADGGGGVACAR
jgi:DNA-binding NtrC family response regulator